MSMFNFGHLPDVEPAQPPQCYRCKRAEVASEDVFVTHCAECLAAIAAEVEAAFGDRGPAQAVLASHRAFAEWLRAHDVADA
jgi:hypothetical protein